jgi:hypothetical protein
MRSKRSSWKPRLRRSASQAEADRRRRVRVIGRSYSAGWMSRRALTSQAITSGQRPAIRSQLRSWRASTRWPTALEMVLRAVERALGWVRPPGGGRSIRTWVSFVVGDGLVRRSPSSSTTDGSLTTLRGSGDRSDPSRREALARAAVSCSTRGRHRADPCGSARDLAYEAQAPSAAPTRDRPRLAAGRVPPARFGGGRGAHGQAEIHATRELQQRHGARGIPRCSIRGGAGPKS